jgi:hypothetical protein
MSKAYKMYEPIEKKLMINRDVEMDEKGCYNRKNQRE